MPSEKAACVFMDKQASAFSPLHIGDKVTFYL